MSHTCIDVCCARTSPLHSRAAYRSILTIVLRCAYLHVDIAHYIIRLTHHIPRITPKQHDINRAHNQSEQADNHTHIYKQATQANIHIVLLLSSLDKSGKAGTRLRHKISLRSPMCRRPASAPLPPPTAMSTVATVAERRQSRKRDTNTQDDRHKRRRVVAPLGLAMLSVTLLVLLGALMPSHCASCK